jgi:predicted ATPase
MAAHTALGISQLVLGAPSPARQHLQQASGTYDPNKHLALAHRYSFDLGTLANAYCAWSLWLLGYPDQALQCGNRATALLEEVRHPYTQSRALYWDAVLQQFRREWPMVHERVEAAMRSANEHGFALVRAVATIMGGAALAAQGQSAVGATQIRCGLGAHGATGAKYQRPHFLAMLAEALRAQGSAEEGLDALAEAAALVEKSGERYYEAEIHRLRGELLLALSAANRVDAEACFQQALEVSRRQQARSLELRAVTSLARLWRGQRKRTEARDLLAPVYGWFTEGFDTADLKEAKALLDGLT